ncbi:MAG TPA: cytochrome c [Chitinophagaceae bacterium]|nr:cytochrome c [Chitinophagaceae bacterium]
MLSEKKKILTAVILVIAFLFYSGHLYLSLPVKGKSVNEETGLGKSVWQQYNCNACHQVYGLGGFLGPDLTNTFSRRGPDYISAFVQSGTGAMPGFQLNRQEMNALLAYLQNIDASGKADPRTFTINIDGSIEQ